MLHLFHPALVHVSVAFLVAGGVCEAAGILIGRDRLERFGGVLVVAGAASLLPTAVTGYLALNSVTLPPGAAAAADLHERLAIAVLASFATLVLWKAWGGGEVAPRWRRAYAGALLAATGLAAWTAFAGGDLVYGFGVGVSGP